MILSGKHILTRTSVLIVCKPCILWPCHPSQKKSYWQLFYSPLFSFLDNLPTLFCSSSFEISISTITSLISESKFSLTF